MLQIWLKKFTHMYSLGIGGFSRLLLAKTLRTLWPAGGVCSWQGLLYFHRPTGIFLSSRLQSILRILIFIYHLHEASRLPAPFQGFFIRPLLPSTGIAAWFHVLVRILRGLRSSAWIQVTFTILLECDRICGYFVTKWRHLTRGFDEY